jgi:hypothetical protein
MRKRVTEFMTWREDNGVTSITAVQPLHVSAWIEQQTHEHAAPTAKLRLAVLRHLFNWLVTGQVIPTNRCAGRRSGEVWQDDGAGTVGKSTWLLLILRRESLLRVHAIRYLLVNEAFEVLAK